MKYMLDTNICIYIIKKQPEHVLEKFTKQAIGDICISAITLAELEYGVYKSTHREKNQKALTGFITPLEIMPFDEEVTPKYGYLRSHLERVGTPIGSLDQMIAAHAITLGSILVTNNKKEFQRVPSLQIEDWVNEIA